MGRTLRQDRVKRLASRVGWAVADQTLSSATNFVLGIVAARSVSSERFGAFALAFATYLLLLGISRSLLTDPLVVRFSAEANARVALAVRSCTGAAFSVGILGGLACVGVGLLATDAVRTTFFSLAVFLPGLLLQDAWRYSFVAQKQPKHTFLNDLLWAVVMLPLLASLPMLPGDQLTNVVIVWGLSGTLAGVIGMAQARAVPSIRGIRRWVSDQRDLGVRYLAEFISLTGSFQIAMYGIGVIASLAAVGALRAGQLLLGPVNILFLGATLIAVPEATRILKRSRRHFRMWLTAVSVSLGVAPLVWGGVLTVIPDSLGRTLLGASWEGARSVVLPLAFGMSGTGFAAGALSGFRATQAAREGLRARILVSPVIVVAGVVGAAANGAHGAAWGFAGAYWLACVLYWNWFRRSFNEEPRSSAPTSSDALTLPTTHIST